jgi:hypothetical protein
MAEWTTQEMLRHESRRKTNAVNAQRTPADGRVNSVRRRVFLFMTKEVIMRVLNGLLGVVLGILTAVLGVALGILAAVVWLVGMVLSVTVILLPLGIPVTKLGRRLFTLAGDLMHIP